MTNYLILCFCFATWIGDVDVTNSSRLLILLDWIIAVAMSTLLLINLCKSDSIRLQSSMVNDI